MDWTQHVFEILLPELKRTCELHVTCFMTLGHVIGVKLAYPGVISPKVSSLLTWEPDVNLCRVSTLPGSCGQACGHSEGSTH